MSLFLAWTLLVPLTGLVLAARRRQAATAGLEREAAGPAVAHVYKPRPERVHVLCSAGLGGAIVPGSLMDR